MNAESLNILRRAHRACPVLRYRSIRTNGILHWRARTGIKPIGEGLSKLRIDYGPGYRVYFVQRGDVLIVLLAGGDKRTQDQDIRLAKQLARNL